MQHPRSRKDNKSRHLPCLSVCMSLCLSACLYVHGESEEEKEGEREHDIVLPIQHPTSKEGKESQRVSASLCLSACLMSDFKQIHSFSVFAGAREKICTLTSRVLQISSQWDHLLQLLLREHKIWRQGGESSAVHNSRGEPGSCDYTGEDTMALGQARKRTAACHTWNIRVGTASLCVQCHHSHVAVANAKELWISPPSQAIQPSGQVHRHSQAVNRGSMKKEARTIGAKKEVLFPCREETQSTMKGKDPFTFPDPTS